jgi:hypothetical protein
MVITLVRHETATPLVERQTTYTLTYLAFSRLRLYRGEFWLGILFGAFVPAAFTVYTNNDPYKYNGAADTAGNSSIQQQLGSFVFRFRGRLSLSIC